MEFSDPDSLRSALEFDGAVSSLLLYIGLMAEIWCYLWMRIGHLFWGVFL